ncbi:MAG: hypothetical protein LH645_11260 [Actinomycetia bacterium]|nr:hypothetical protein [Actinomycetes bacterium]
MDFESGWNQAWVSVAGFLPQFAAFLLILLIGWLIAKALAKIPDAVLERVGFDRAVEHGGVGRPLQQSHYDASDLVAKFVYYAVLLLALQTAFGVFGPNAVSVLLADVTAWLPQAALAIVIVVVAAAIATAVRDLIGNTLGGLSYGQILANVASVFILGLGITAALNQIGVATTVTTPILIAVLATAAGILIVGVGGGLVRPMQQIWQGWIGTLEQEGPAIKAQIDLRMSQGTSTLDARASGVRPGERVGGGHPSTSRPL